VRLGSVAEPLTDVERKVVDFLEEGYARWKIAELLGLGDTTVRGVIKRLCERYQCSMRDLPKVVKGEHDVDGHPDDEEEPARDPDAGT
jgi:transposase-like protein